MRREGGWEEGGKGAGGVTMVSAFQNDLIRVVCLSSLRP